MARVVGLSSYRSQRIGDTDLGYTKLAIRCAVTLVDRHTGSRAGPEPALSPPTAAPPRAESPSA